MPHEEEEEVTPTKTEAAGSPAATDAAAATGAPAATDAPVATDAPAATDGLDPAATAVFVFVLFASGVQNVVAELLPALQAGPVEVGVAEFLFVPVVLVVLFDRPAAALAAPLGEIVFAEFLLGEFEGIGEFEEVVIVAAALYLAARLVRDPTRPRSYALAALFVAGVQGLAAAAIDVLKVYVGVGTAFRETTGLAGGVVAVELLDLLVFFIVTGVLFGALPAARYGPRLHGRLEPLLGLEPRDPGERRGAATAVLYLLAALPVGFALTATGELIVSVAATGAAPPLALAAIGLAVVLGVGLLLALRRGWIDPG